MKAEFQCTTNRRERDFYEIKKKNKIPSLLKVVCACAIIILPFKSTSNYDEAR